MGGGHEDGGCTPDDSTNDLTEAGDDPKVATDHTVLLFQVNVIGE